MEQKANSIELVNGWAIGHPGRYIISSIIVSLIIRFISALLKRIEGTPILPSLYGVGAKDPEDDDYWQPFVLGILESMAYPILMVSSNWTFIGAWLGFKTVAQWKRWTEKRRAFNRFLIGNAILLILSLTWLSSFVQVKRDESLMNLPATKVETQQIAPATTIKPLR